MLFENWPRGLDYRPSLSCSFPFLFPIFIFKISLSLCPYFESWEYFILSFIYSLYWFNDSFSGIFSVLQLLGGAFENNQHTIWTAAKVCCWLALVLFLIVLMERVASYPWDAFFKSIFDVLALELPGFRGCTEKGGWLVLLQSSPLGTLWTLSKGDSEPSLLWWVIWDQLLKSFLTVVKNTPQCRRCRFNPWVGTIPWKREW